MTFFFLSTIKTNYLPQKKNKRKTKIRKTITKIKPKRKTKSITTIIIKFKFNKVQDVQQKKINKRK